MPRKKLKITATDQQLSDLKRALSNGAPLPIALKSAGISMATYYYWVAIASVVVLAESQKEIEGIEEIVNSGISIQKVRDLALQNATKKGGVDSFIEPSQESILAYKNNSRFRKFADSCYEIISECDKLKSNFATYQLSQIALSTDKKRNINPSGAMWWLERNLPDFFAKPSDKAPNTLEEQSNVPAIQVEFIDPTTEECKERIRQMDEVILNEVKSGGSA